MEFNKLAVLMNPPYQMNDGGGTGSSAVPIYHFFIEVVIDRLSPNYLVSINPSRWMIGGKGLDKFRERMMSDRRIRRIAHFPGHNEVFPSVSISGGVNYFLWDREYDGLCEFVVGNSSVRRHLDEYDIILQDNQALPILQKVVHKTNGWLSTTCSSQKPFGLRSNFSAWKKEGIPCYCVGRKVHLCDSGAFTDKNEMFHRWKACVSKATSQGNINVSMKDKHGTLDLWKVATSKANGAAQNPDANGKKRVMTNFFVIEPGAVCTETFIIVRAFGSKGEAENFITYMQTRFFRFMVSLRLSTQNISKKSFAWVPDVENYSTPWTDKELYDMFGLTRQERKYIESKIKELP